SPLRGTSRRWSARPSGSGSFPGAASFRHPTGHPCWLVSLQGVDREQLRLEYLVVMLVQPGFKFFQTVRETSREAREQAPEQYGMARAHSHTPAIALDEDRMTFHGVDTAVRSEGRHLT